MASTALDGVASQQTDRFCGLACLKQRDSSMASLYLCLFSYAQVRYRA